MKASSCHVLEGTLASTYLEKEMGLGIVSKNVLHNTNANALEALRFEL